MATVGIGNPTKEFFELPNNYSVKIDYGVIDNEFDNPYIPFYARLVGSYRRAILSKNNKIIDEILEENPDMLSDEEELKLPENARLQGNDFGRLINFNNGIIFKLEYMVSPKNEENLGVCYSKFRKLSLFKKEEIISESLELNPLYDPTPPSFVTVLDPDILE